MSAVMIHPTRLEAVVELMTAAAWVDKKGCDYCDHVCDPGTPMIHTVASGLGADWDLESAIEYVRTAEKVAWVDSIFGHELAAQHQDRIVTFQVKKPTP